MAARTDAQEEFDRIVSRAADSETPNEHPADRQDYQNDRDTGDDVDEETAYAQQRIDETMRTPSLGGDASSLRLPPREFDQGRTTGVKGVIADARSFEEARRAGPWFGRSNSARDKKRSSMTSLMKDEHDGSVSDDDGFLESWRRQRRAELQQKGNDIRTRRTSPSVRRYGRFDEVDALGYLDAIEKVGRETVVVVFVYDNEVYPPLVPSSPSFILPSH
jgi:hypothetical protein